MGLPRPIAVAREELAGGRRAEAAGLRRGLVRVAERSGGLAGSVRAEDPRRRRGSRAGPVYRFVVGGPQSRAAGAVVVVAKTEAGRLPRAVVALRLVPLPRVPAARGGVMESFAHGCVALGASAASMFSSVFTRR